MVFVAEIDAEPVGCIICSGTEIVVLHSLGVLPRCRGRGIALSLIRAAERTARELLPEAVLAAAVVREAPHHHNRFLELGFSDAGDIGGQHLVLQKGVQGFRP